MEEDRRPGEHPGRRTARLGRSSPATRATIDPELAARAEAHGVATWYEDWRHRRVDVSPDTVRAVLAALNAADSPAAAPAWPSTIVLRRGEQDAPHTVPLPRAASTALVQLEDGTTLDVPVAGDVLELPGGLPLGYHRLLVGSDAAHLIVAPQRCPRPTAGRVWGWMLQLYAARSAVSWGVGDLRDLATLARWAGAQGAGYLLCNPLHAPTPVTPLEPSPYYPSSRRFTNPLYLRVEDVDALEAADPAVRERIAVLGAAQQAANRSDRIDRDAAWRAKLEALEALHAVGRSAAHDAEFAAYRRREGQPLEDFATFCALAERHGTPYQAWPAGLRHPRGAAVDAARGELAGRVELHAWLQWLCDVQLAAAQEAATAAGMPLGILHDLAVGVDPGGADAWALQDDLAGTATVGAPPDSFNQQGQDWRVPPLRPDRLAATGYAAFRHLVGAALRHGAGVRIDHILGLFRLWWIPENAGPADGTYVRYPADDLLAVLALEAQRADGLVVGEDLGTVERGVRQILAGQGLLGSRVLYFERDRAGRFRPPAAYPEQVLASVTTHDLPTAAGWLADAEVHTQAGLGLLAADTTREDELARKARLRESLIRLLREEGLVGNEPSPGDLIVAMHALLARTPSLLVAASLSDAVGDTRQPNMPGTTDEYPNWRLPLAAPADGGARPVLVDELPGHAGASRLAESLRR